MKQLHIIPRFIGGGPERALLAFIERDKRLGRDWQHDVIVLEAPVTPRLFLQARRLGVTLAIRPAQDALLRAVEAADLVLLHYWNHPALTALLREVALPPSRLLLWAHVLGTRAPQVLFADLGRFADRLVLTSEASFASAAANCAAALGRSVDHVLSVIDPARLAGFAPRPHDGICVGYLGLVNAGKMHPRFAELCLATRTPGLRFVVCGGGGGEQALRDRFAALGAAARVEIRGHVEDVAAALAGFDIFGYPLAEDSYATSELALQEAMWVGLPPVIFAHGGVGQLVRHELTGLVAEDEAGYAAALDRLAGDAALRRRLGGEARRFARSAFDPARWSQVLDRILGELMASPRRLREPLPGAGQGAAAGFVRTLGEQAGPFAVSLAGSPLHSPAAVAAADREIAAASPLLARGEGGIVHYRNANPEDPYLRYWSALVSAAAGSMSLAENEFSAASALGLPPGRSLRPAPPPAPPPSNPEFAPTMPQSAADKP